MYGARGSRSALVPALPCPPAARGHVPKLSQTCPSSGQHPPRLLITSPETHCCPSCPVLAPLPHPEPPPCHLRAFVLAALCRLPSRLFNRPVPPPPAGPAPGTACAHAPGDNAGGYLPALTWGLAFFRTPCVGPGLGPRPHWGAIPESACRRPGRKITRGNSVPLPAETLTCYPFPVCLRRVLLYSP